MTLMDAPIYSDESASVRLRTVICGSFRRDPHGLQREFDALSIGCEILSPVSLDFADPTAEFVRLPHEFAETEAEIEERHLAAIRGADFVWLHCPGGYVGVSAAMELGHANATGVPVYASHLPSDPVLAANVIVVSSPMQVSRAMTEVADRPGTALDRLQRYYHAASVRRGWDKESPRDTLLLMTEELGELARAVRKSEGLSRHHGDDRSDVGAELADVQLYLLHLANTLGLDLSAAVTNKERINAKRYLESEAA